MKCAEVKEMLPAYARDKDAQASLGIRRHLARCPDCRGELAHYDALADGLHLLTTVTAEPPPGLERNLVAIAHDGRRAGAVVDHVRRNRRVYAGGVAAALIGTGATVLVRRRLAAA